MNYNMTNNKTVYNYLSKIIYKKINKKKYKLQILKHNICYINVITIQNAILITKILVKNAKKKFIIYILNTKVM